MKTVGEILKQARIKKSISKKEVAKKTKINLKYIAALEKNDFAHLPEAAFVKGFIRNFAKLVGLKPQQALAIFRRDFDQTVKGKVIPRDLVPSPVRKQSLWNPKTTKIFGIILVVVTLAFYFIYQYRLLTSAPSLEIINPQENEEVVSTVTINGTTDPQATLTINSQQVQVEQDGSFSQSLILSSGTRTITIQTTNRSGKSRTIQRTVHVTP